MSMQSELRAYQQEFEERATSDVECLWSTFKKKLKLNNVQVHPLQNNSRQTQQNTETMVVQTGQESSEKAEDALQETAKDMSPKGCPTIQRDQG